MTKWHAFLVMAAMMIPSVHVVYGQVVPDGGTVTSVSTDAGGQVTVTVALPNASQTSLNTYSDFNVNAAGVILDNAVADARTIVNEVTSTNTSSILGKLEVIGSDSHVIIANPNGILVNGGEFINTGGIALVSGKISARTVSTGAGISDIRPVATTSPGGFITITGDGMKGDMTQVLLAAETVTVDGSLSFEDQLVGQNVTIHGGSNEIEFDSAVAASNTLLPWYQVTDQAGDVSGVVIDVTDQANIIGGSISLVVNDAGAGVRSAGDMTANAGDLLIKLNGGKAEFFGGTIAASGAIRIEAGEIEAVAQATRAGVIQALSKDVQLTTTVGDISLTNYQVSGAAQVGTDTNSLAGVTLVSAEDILLFTDDASITTLVTSAIDGLHLQAVGNITNNTSQIVASDGNITIQAGGAFDNIVDVTPTTISGAGGTPGCFLIFCFGSTQFTADYGTLRMPGQQAFVTATSGNVTITANTAKNHGGTIVANDGGDITINVTNGFENEAISSGQVTVGRSCFLFFCSGSGSSSQTFIGGELAANGQLIVDGGSSLVNTGGTMFGNGGVTLTADQITNLGVDFVSAVEHPAGLKGLFGWFGGTGNLGFSYTQKTGGVIATGGSTDIRFNTANVVTNTDGQFVAGGSVVAPNGINETTTPPFLGPIAPEPIGLFFPVLRGIDEDEATGIVVFWPGLFLGLLM